MYGTGKAQPIIDTTEKCWRGRILSVSTVGVGWCRDWPPCGAHREVGFGYIERRSKLVGTLSSQSIVCPPLHSVVV